MARRANFSRDAAFKPSTRRYLGSLPGAGADAPLGNTMRSAAPGSGCRRCATPRLDLSGLREMANDNTLTEPPLSPVHPGFTF
ncbi:hypothetical protein [Polaromonas aquatica]|uniref:hypothetical protein n=1 Tax=Polaromonas aquatica TaxID=332657 RepID=UPI003D659331